MHAAPPVRHEEEQYLDVVRDLLAGNGDQRMDRTGVGTTSRFGVTMRYDLSDGKLPLFTTKRVAIRSVIKELLFFLRGDTNANHLSEQGVPIWDLNSSREYLTSIGLPHRKAGDLGPVYGWQWRHWGAEYIDMDTDYRGMGFDQLDDVITRIKRSTYGNVSDRRLIISAWNVRDIPLMALPPCHMDMQFYVSPSPTGLNHSLSCMMHQRSADLGLGVPFNVASYSILTHMIAHVCGMRAKELIHVMGDTHVYNNHVAELKLQLERTPRPFPTLSLDKWVVTNDHVHAFDRVLQEEHIEVIGYDPHPAIKMPQAK